MVKARQIGGRCLCGTRVCLAKRVSRRTPRREVNAHFATRETARHLDLGIGCDVDVALSVIQLVIVGDRRGPLYLDDSPVGVQRATLFVRGSGFYVVVVNARRTLQPQNRRAEPMPERSMLVGVVAVCLEVPTQLCHAGGVRKYRTARTGRYGGAAVSYCAACCNERRVRTLIQKAAPATLCLTVLRNSTGFHAKRRALIGQSRRAPVGGGRSPASGVCQRVLYDASVS